jgi:hypothetical protein
MSRRTNGATVSGAMPMPAETSATARLRLCSIHAVAIEIIGA